MDVPERLTHVTNEEARRIIALIEDGRSQRYVAGVICVQKAPYPESFIAIKQLDSYQKTRLRLQKGNLGIR